MFNIPQYETEQQWRRRIEQHLLLLDVDVKRLWGRVSQTVDQIGTFPINPAVFQETTSSSSSSSSESSSGSPCEDAPTSVTVSITGHPNFDDASWCLPRVACHADGYVKFERTMTPESGNDFSPSKVTAEWLPDQERWVATIFSVGETNGFDSEFGTPVDASPVSLENELAGDSDTEVTLTGSASECPESSSSSSEPSSSEESTSEASTSEESSSSGASSSEESSSGTPSSSSEESSGAPSSSSGASSTSGFVGEASNGETSEAGNSYTDPDCDGNVCATWQWIGGNWERINFNPGACPTECATGCVEVPRQEGYPGLYADVRCDGDIYYYEPA